MGLIVIILLSGVAYLDHVADGINPPKHETRVELPNALGN
jgi:hypothetical protein